MLSTTGWWAPAVDVSMVIADRHWPSYAPAGPLSITPAPPSRNVLSISYMKCSFCLVVMGRCRYFKSRSFFRYIRSVFFQVGSVFVVDFFKYRDIGSVLSVFHFASKRHVRILKFCFRVSLQILTEGPGPCSRRWQNLAIRCRHLSADLPWRFGIAVTRCSRSTQLPAG